MGKKRNPTYREKVARRLQLPKCHFCERRGSKLVWYKERRFHKTCIIKWEAMLVKQETEQAATREAQRQNHQAVKDWWILKEEEANGSAI